LIVLAIDPGPRESAYVYVASGTYNVLDKGKFENEVVRKIILDGLHDRCVIEECIARKWAGRDISDTAFEAGRFAECSCVDSGFTLISRSKVRGHLTTEKRGGDGIMIQELIKKFEPDIYSNWKSGEISHAKMIIEAKKGFFNGFKGDVWQALALAVTFIDIKGV